jgi:hypothetical protein
MKRSRFASIVAIAIVVMLALSGCVATDAVTKKNLIELELAKLSGALYSLPYVGVVSTFYNEDAEFDQQVRVVVSATIPTAERAIVIAVAANAALSQDLLSTMSRSFELKNEGTTQFWQSEFGLTPDELSTELRYLFALQHAAGVPLSMGLDVPWDDTAVQDYQRSIDAGLSIPQPGDWDALRSVEAPKKSAVQAWYFAGLSIIGSLPPPEVTDLLHVLEPVLPLYNSDQTVGYSWTSWDSIRQRFDVAIDYLDQGGTTSTQPFTDKRLWSQVHAAAALIAESGVAGSSLVISSTVNDEYQSATVHFGTCAINGSVLNQDTAFADALMASGIELPSGSGPGHCDEF